MRKDANGRYTGSAETALVLGYAKQSGATITVFLTDGSEMDPVEAQIAAKAIFADKSAQSASCSVTPMPPILLTDNGHLKSVIAVQRLPLGKQLG